MAILFMLSSCYYSSYSQELINDYQIKFKRNYKTILYDMDTNNLPDDPRKTYTAVLNDIEKVAVFHTNGIHIEAKLLDNQLQVIDSYSLKKPQANYNRLLGHSISDAIFLWYSNSKQNKVQAVKVDFANASDSFKEMEIPFKKEKYLLSFSHNNMFYILMIRKNKSVLNLYEFTDETNFSNFTIDLSEYNFTNDKFPQLYHALYDIEQSPLSFDANFAFLDQSIPNYLSSAARKNKAMIENNKLYLIIDNTLLTSRVVAIDLAIKNATVKTLTQEVSNCNNQKTLSNSIVYGGNLFQIGACKSYINLIVRDLVTNAEVVSYIINESETVFPNTIYDQSGGLTNYSIESVVDKKSLCRNCRKTKLVYCYMIAAVIWN